MEPFAYPKKHAPDRRKLLLMALAGASFSIWYFDFVPELAPVSTGALESDLLDPNLTADDFIALLESAPNSAPPMNSDYADMDTDLPAEATAASSEAIDATSEDPLFSSLADEPESIEAAFPEFADVHDANPSKPQPPTNPGLRPVEVSSSTTGSSGIQQASFDVTGSPANRAAFNEPVLSADVADHLNDIDRWIDAGETLEAHAALSRMYWKGPALRPHLQDRLNKTSAEIYANPSRHFAEPYMVQFGDTLDSIARNYSVPWQYLARLNRVSAKTLQAGQQLKVLKGPFGAVVDLKDKRLTLHAHGWYVRSYSVGIGRDHSTPQGEFAVKEKLENPTWYNPAGGVVDGDDPSNPLGEYWIGLGNHLGIHGTIDPDSIGASVSQGCIHLADDDIMEVFQLLGQGSPVVIR